MQKANKPKKKKKRERFFKGTFYYSGIMFFLRKHRREQWYHLYISSVLLVSISVPTPASIYTEMFLAAQLVTVPTGEAQRTSKMKTPQVLESEWYTHSWNSVYNDLCSKTKKNMLINNMKSSVILFFFKSTWKDMFRKVILITGDLEASEISETGMFFHR